MSFEGREWEGGLKKRAEGLGALKMTLEEQFGEVEKAGWLSPDVAVPVDAMVKLGFNNIDAMEKD